MPLTFVDKDPLVCPVVICDHCGDQINTPDGHVLWVPNFDQETVRYSSFVFVHQRCDRPYEHRTDQHYWWRELKEFLDQLAFNYANPFTTADVS